MERKEENGGGEGGGGEPVAFLFPIPITPASLEIQAAVKNAFLSKKSTEGKAMLQIFSPAGCLLVVGKVLVRF